MSTQGMNDDSFEVHFPEESLREEVEMNEIAERPDLTTECSHCDNKAAVRCLDCKHYLCDTCHVTHKSSKTMRNHRVVSMEDILSGKVDLLAADKTICEVHREVQKYYCKDEEKALCHDCIILRTCATDHDRVTIIEAAQEKYEEMEAFLKKSDRILKQYQDSDKEVGVIEQELEIHSQTAKEALVKAEQEYIQLLKKTVRRFEDEIDNIKEERMKDLNEKKTEFKSSIQNIENATEDVAQIIQSPNKMDIISGYSSISTNLRSLSKSQPDKVDKTFGYINFEPAVPSVLTIGQLSETVPRKSAIPSILTNGQLSEHEPREPWKLIGQFSTGDFNELLGLELDEDDDIVVCSWGKGVKVFTRNGDVKSTIYDSPGTISVGVLLGKKYVTAPRGTKQIKICDSRGKKAITYPITNVNKVASIANSLTVDCDDRIIVGQVKNTISIHNPDGSLISKLATKSEPYRLAATSSEEIVCSFYDSEYKRGTSVKLMDYIGGNVKVIQPPDEVKVWSPGFVCCKQGEIFVSNEGSGNPNGIYAYTYEGTYLGCVTKEVKNPTGIAMSNDGMELFVADRGDRHVKIFQRP